MSREICGICWCPYDEDTGECACAPEPKKINELKRADPTQRNPLTKVDLRALYDQHAAYQEEGPEASGWWEFARAVERAHGIGSSDVGT